MELGVDFSFHSPVPSILGNQGPLLWWELGAEDTEEQGGAALFLCVLCPTA